MIYRVEKSFYIGGNYLTSMVRFDEIKSLLCESDVVFSNTAKGCNRFIKPFVIKPLLV